MGKGERLQKVMARAGVASRRKCEELIREGRVAVNGLEAELGCRVDPGRDHIAVDGESIAPEELVYILLNKPEGYISTVSDPHGRPTVVDLLSSVNRRVYPVGRLDADTTGLLLLTNDGELTNRLLHPRYESKKTYLVRVKGRPSEDELTGLREGIQLEDGRTAPAEVELLQEREELTILRLSIHEGRNRQVRRMMGVLGYRVLELERVSMGPLSLGLLRPGCWRELTAAEVKQLREYVGLST